MDLKDAHDSSCSTRKICSAVNVGLDFGLTVRYHLKHSCQSLKTQHRARDTSRPFQAIEKLVQVPWRLFQNQQLRYLLGFVTSALFEVFVYLVLAVSTLMVSVIISFHDTKECRHDRRSKAEKSVQGRQQNDVINRDDVIMTSELRQVLK